VDEPENAEFSLTASEALTVLAVGVAVACTAYGVGRVRRFVNRLDPTSEFRHRLKAARADYREERDAWLHIGLFGPTVKRLRGASAAYDSGRREVGEATHALRHLMRELRAIQDAGKP
jgi:hypothetical protein